MDATNALTCYHADAQANIIALTDGSANTTAQYAYTPYGRVVGTTNLQSQFSNPYLFVGSQGVMEELPGLYFMHARYYASEAAVFLSTDPQKKIGPGWKPVAYSYANGNPTGYIDPLGLFGVNAVAPLSPFPPGGIGLPPTEPTIPPVHTSGIEDAVEGILENLGEAIGGEIGEWLSGDDGEPPDPFKDGLKEGLKRALKESNKRLKDELKKAMEHEKLIKLDKLDLSCSRDLCHFPRWQLESERFASQCVLKCF